MSLRDRLRRLIGSAKDHTWIAGTPRGSRQAGRPHSRWLRIERLEERTVLAVGVPVSGDPAAEPALDAVPALIGAASATATDPPGAPSATPVTSGLRIRAAEQQGPNINLTGSAGNDRFVVRRGATANDFRILVNGSSLGDFTLGPSGRLQIDGQGGNDTITVRGTRRSNVFSLTPTGIELDGAPIDLPSTARLVLNGNGGSDRLIGLDIPNTFRLTGRQSGNLNGTLRFSGIRNLTGGDDTNRFLVSGTANGFGTLQGGGSVDTLDFSAVTVSFRVNLGNFSAFGIARFEGVENLIGGLRAAATLVGSNLPSTFLIDATNAGTVAGLLFSQFVNLIGGQASDSFVISAAPGQTGQTLSTIRGGGGTNVLDLSVFPLTDRDGVRVDLTQGTATGVGRIAGIQVIVGSSGNDFLTGNSRTVSIVGGGGQDLIRSGRA